MKLQRHPANPVLTTVHHHNWEDRTCFNCAAIYENGHSHCVLLPAPARSNGGSHGIGLV